MDEIAKVLLSTTDAWIWAAKFMEVIENNDIEVDEAFMIAWFANAIETGRSAGDETGYERGFDAGYLTGYEPHKDSEY